MDMDPAPQNLLRVARSRKFSLEGLQNFSRQSYNFFSRASAIDSIVCNISEVRTKISNVHHCRKPGFDICLRIPTLDFSLPPGRAMTWLFCRWPHPRRCCLLPAIPPTWSSPVSGIPSSSTSSLRFKIYLPVLCAFCDSDQICTSFLLV
jgi:hypothetical protein